MTKRLPSPKHADTLSLKALRSLVSGLVEQVEALSTEAVELRAEAVALRKETAELRLENARLNAENQLLRDEIARLKNLPPRPRCRPDANSSAAGAAQGAPARRIICLGYRMAARVTAIKNANADRERLTWTIRR
jgi:regulator of replication initiation timing